MCNNADPFGLWPSLVHDELIASALGGKASPFAIRKIQAGSRHADRLRNQLPDRSYIHSMRSSDESSQAAMQERDAFVDGKLAEARGLLGSGDYVGALGAFGEAIHPLMDATSPFHTDASGDPMVWSPGTPGAIRAHTDGENATQPTQAQIDENKRRIQAAYNSVFGKPL